MQTNISEQQYFGGDLQLTTPHFDEEATVLSARPVVPLASIKETGASVRPTRHLVFGLSILASLMLGALGATLIYKQGVQEPAAVIVSASVPGSGALAFASVLTPPATGEAKGGVSEEEGWSANSPAADKKPEPQIARVVAQPGATRKVPPVKTAKKQAEPRYEVDEIETGRAERMETRRFRRRAERDEENEARSHRRRRADDLLRIREIFEGPGRP